MSEFVYISCTDWCISSTMCYGYFEKCFFPLLYVFLSVNFILYIKNSKVFFNIHNVSYFFAICYPQCLQLFRIGICCLRCAWKNSIFIVSDASCVLLNLIAKDLPVCAM